MARYFEVRNDNNIVQLNDTFKPLFLVRKGVLTTGDATVRKGATKTHVSAEIELYENEYNVAIRNPSESKEIRYFSAVVNDTKNNRRYVTLELEGEDKSIVDGLEFYVYGLGEIRPMMPGDIGLEVRNENGEVIYTSKTPIAKITHSIFDCAVPTYHGRTDNSMVAGKLIWDFAVVWDNEHFLRHFSSHMPDDIRSWAWRNNPIYADQEEYNKYWEEIAKGEGDRTFAQSKYIALGQRSKLAIMVNRLPCMDYCGINGGGNVKRCGIIGLTRDTARLDARTFPDGYFNHLPWGICRGPQPMISILALDVIAN